MAQDPNAHPPRPPLALRVGVTGAPDIDPNERARVIHAASDILGAVASKVHAFVGVKEARACYDDDGSPLLRLLSPLAQGADRIVARAALDLGYKLYAPLPFARADYELGFPATVEEFGDLLNEADHIELDGLRALRPEEGYRESGRFVVRNCDLLIAVWDDEAVRKAGGPAEIVRFALQTRLPVWWIDASPKRRPPRLLERPAHLRKIDRAMAGEAGHVALGEYLTRLLLPEERFQEPLATYLQERPYEWRWRWRGYNWMMALLTPFRKSDVARAPVEGWWERYYTAADTLSLAYGDRYRSSYVWIAFLVFLTLTVTAVGHFLPCECEPQCAQIEMVSLGLIAFFVWKSRSSEFNERWVACRLIAELCRQQYLLSPLGRALPASEVERVACERGLEGDGAQALSDAEFGEEMQPPSEAWAAWYFAAIQRAAPLPKERLAERCAEAKAHADALIKEQIEYHRIRWERQRSAGKTVNFVGYLFFLMTLICAVFKVFATTEGVRDASALLVEIFSAGSGGLLGIRAYAEFFLLKGQSSQMLRDLTDASTELDAIEPTAPYASLDVGRVLFTLALAMMQDIKGWSQLYVVKSIDM